VALAGAAPSPRRSKNGTLTSVTVWSLQETGQHTNLSSNSRPECGVNPQDLAGPKCRAAAAHHAGILRLSFAPFFNFKRPSCPKAEEIVISLRSVGVRLARFQGHGSPR
jgi:hypothetical protein